MLERFTKKELQNINQAEVTAENVIKRKVDKLYVKWQGYDNSSNSYMPTYRIYFALTYIIALQMQIS